MFLCFSVPIDYKIDFQAPLQPLTTSRSNYPLPPLCSFSTFQGQFCVFQKVRGGLGALCFQRTVWHSPGHVSARPTACRGGALPREANGQAHGARTCPRRAKELRAGKAGRQRRAGLPGGLLGIPVTHPVRSPLSWVGWGQRRARTQ